MERGEVAYTDGPDAAALMADMGMTLFPWELDVLDAWLSRDSSDRPSYVTCGLSVPRQNGKNAILEAAELYWLAACGYHVLHTAHRVKTAKKSFQRLVRYFTDRRHPDACGLVRNIRYTNGEEAVYLGNGGALEFSARSRAGARGFDDIQVVVFDEAQDLTDEQLSAIMYTLAASSTGDRQLVFTGTPPDANAPGTVFSRNRRAALGPNPPARSLWCEWGAKDGPPRDKPSFADVLDLVYECNPSMGYTLSEDFTETEYANADALGFWTERLGWWSEQSAAAAIPAGEWSGCAVAAEEAARTGKKAFGVKFSPDGSCVALAGCVLPEGGPAHVELIGTGSMADGIGWLTEFFEQPGMDESTAAIAVDGRNGSGALLAELAETYPRQALMVPGSRGVQDAASMFLQAVHTGREVGGVTHWGSDKQASLDESAKESIKRPIGSDGGWGFGGEHSAPVEAAALAFWAARTTRRDPEGGCVIL